MLFFHLFRNATNCPSVTSPDIHRSPVLGFADYVCACMKIKKGRHFSDLLVIPLGLEPRAPTLKVLCSTS